MDNEYEHIDDSKLKALKVSGGFSVPPHYFNQLRNHVLEETVGSQKRDLNVPEGYFERSRMAILQKTVGSTPQPQLTVWYKKAFLKYAAAAVLMATITVGFWIARQPTIPESIATISDEEILDYLEKEDMRDVPISEVSFTSISTSAVTEEETYIINQTDEQILLEEL